MKVRGSQIVVESIELTDYKAYIRSNIRKINEPGNEETGEMGFEGWEYDEIEMSLNEYHNLIKSGINTLEEADLDNKEALTELYEMLIEGGK